MTARRIGTVLGALAALLMVMTGGGVHTLSAARAEDPDTTLEPTIPPPTDPPPTDPPQTQPDITPDSTAPPPQPKPKPGRTTTTSRHHGTNTTITTRSTGTTEPAAAVVETTAAPETTTTVTEPPTTSDRVAGPVALPTHHDKDTSKLPLVALVAAGLGLTGIAVAGVRGRRRPPSFESTYDTMAVPALFPPADESVHAPPEPVVAPATDWAPAWEDAAAETAAVGVVETARARRKRERRERAHSEHEPTESVAAATEPATEPEPERAPDPSRAVAPDPYEQIDLSGPVAVEPATPDMPDMHIDFSDPDL
ncbi:MAG: hypothetical protein QOG90_2100 [Actinomycetota bacterium]|jgi:hypothetical protein